MFRVVWAHVFFLNLSRFRLSPQLCDVDRIASFVYIVCLRLRMPWLQWHITRSKCSLLITKMIQATNSMNYQIVYWNLRHEETLKINYDCNIVSFSLTTATINMCYWKVHYFIQANSTSSEIKFRLFWYPWLSSFNCIITVVLLNTEKSAPWPRNYPDYLYWRTLYSKA